MTPQFSSPDLNNLLQQELSTGGYESVEDALIAGLRILRENRERQAEFESRLSSLRDGNVITVESDQQLGAFLDEIDAEVDRELNASIQPEK